MGNANNSLLCIRAGLNEISLTACSYYGDEAPEQESRPVDLDASLNVNLRDFLSSSPLARRRYARVAVLADAPYALKPLKYFSVGDEDRIYRHCFHDTAGKRAFFEPVPVLGAAFIFGWDEAAYKVTCDLFPDISVHIGVVGPATHFATAARMASGERLYAWVHENQTDLFAFRNGRLLLGNRYETLTSDDSAYYVMLAVKVLRFDMQHAACSYIAPAPIAGALQSRLSMFLSEVRQLDADTFFAGTALHPVGELPLDLRSFMMYKF